MKRQPIFRLLIAGSLAIASIAGMAQSKDVSAAANKEQIPGYHLSFGGKKNTELVLRLPIQQQNGRFFISLEDSEEKFMDVKFTKLADSSLLLQYPTFKAILFHDSSNISLNGMTVKRSGPAITQLNGSTYISLGELATLLGQNITYDTKSRTIVFDYHSRYVSNWPADKIKAWIEKATGKLFMSQEDEQPQQILTVTRLGDDSYRVFAEKIAEDSILININDDYNNRSKTKVYSLLFHKGKLVRQTEEDYDGRYFMTSTVKDGDLTVMPNGNELLWVHPDGTIEKKLDTASILDEQASLIYADQNIVLFLLVEKQIHVLYTFADEKTTLLYKKLLPLAEQHMLETYWANSEGRYLGDTLSFAGRNGNTLEFHHRILFFAYPNYYNTLTYTIG